MGNFIKFFIMLAFILTAGCASQQPADSGTPNASEGNVESVDVAANSDSENDPNEIICRREMVTGSNFRRRICLTRAQRGEMRSGSREVFNDSRSGSLGVGPTAPAQ
ncbi:MAG: hypothetical protein P8M72_12100 [Gammaproteobacteria bacterium]|nr:hypothetical protein [Gammaproteobacteria bacterium]